MCEHRWTFIRLLTRVDVSIQHQVNTIPNNTIKRLYTWIIFFSNKNIIINMTAVTRITGSLAFFSFITSHIIYIHYFISLVKKWSVAQPVPVFLFTMQNFTRNIINFVYFNAFKLLSCDEKNVCIHIKSYNDVIK